MILKIKRIPLNNLSDTSDYLFPGSTWNITPSMHYQWNYYLILELGMFPPSDMWYLTKITHCGSHEQGHTPKKLEKLVEEQSELDTLFKFTIFQE